MADEPASPGRFRQTIKKRWRAWLRAIHRDVGYLAVGFTLIYAVSGFAMNHIDDWDPSFHASERILKITPVADEATDEEAVAHVIAATGTGKPDEVFRAGDEVRLTYGNSSMVTAIGDTVTVQARSDRFFFRVAVWLHATRGKQAWKYISDAYAVLLFYLAISGLFMIKGRLGLRWRGMTLVALGVGIPVTYIVLSGGPEATKIDPALAKQTDGSGIRLLTPDENEPAPR
ncbi:MAG: PepSY-associated TM helix domain-containing protein [Kofleriaceae bacterium]